MAAAGGGAIDRRALLAAFSSVAFNYNTVEAVMSFCAVLVSLSGLMYQAEMSRSTGIQGTVDSITGFLLLVVVCSLLYFACALGSEVANGLADSAAARAAKRGGSKAAILASSSRADESVGIGEVSAEVNPLFVRSDSSIKIGGDRDSLIASILAQKESPPIQLWTVFRDEFAGLVERVKDLQGKAADGAAALQQLQTLQVNPLARKKSQRSEIKSVMVASGYAGESAGGGGTPRSSLARGLAEAGGGSSPLTSLSTAAAGPAAEPSPQALAAADSPSPPPAPEQQQAEGPASTLKEGMLGEAQEPEEQGGAQDRWMHSSPLQKGDTATT